MGKLTKLEKLGTGACRKGGGFHLGYKVLRANWKHRSGNWKCRLDLQEGGGWELSHTPEQKATEELRSARECG